MSYCRNPYYIFGCDEKIEIYKDSELQGKLDLEAVGQFLVNLFNKARPKFGAGYKDVLQYIEKGLKCERKEFAECKKRGLLDKGDKCMVKKNVIVGLRRIADKLEKGE